MGGRKFREVWCFCARASETGIGVCAAGASTSTRTRKGTRATSKIHTSGSTGKSCAGNTIQSGEQPYPDSKPCSESQPYRNSVAKPIACECFCQPRRHASSVFAGGDICRSATVDPTCCLQRHPDRLGITASNRGGSALDADGCGRRAVDRVEPPPTRRQTRTLVM